ncbi:MAG TPA: Calx-beta domain-containing protein [Acidimicrobiales bacterium]|nr:Calx-beta domain-containing protein [Acidimicrobiales bacterium]
MSRNSKIAAAVAACVVVAVVIGLVVTSGGSQAQQGDVIVFGRVQTRTLQDTVSLTGTLARKQIRNVTAGNAGLVSTMTSTDGSSAHAGQTLFSLNGRPAIAESGTVQFFRSLTLGDQGQDVLQLKKILAAAGDYPGPINDYFNQQTQFALAQWQAQQHYPNSTPATQQAVTVSLEQGSGYKVGAQDSAGLTIGPPPAQTTAVRRNLSSGAAVAGVGSGKATLDAFQTAATPVPSLTIQSVDNQVPEGQAATFVITASSAPASPLTVDLSFGGTAGGNDIVSPPSTAVIQAGATSTTVAVQTRLTTTVQANPTIVASIASGSGYTIGTPSSAQTTIKSTAVPTVTIAGNTTVSPGGSATLTLVASQPPVQTMQVALTAGGSAVAGTDYDPVAPVVTFPPGATTETVTVQTIHTTVIQPSKFLAVAVGQSSSGAYTVGSPGTAIITISESGALPTLTLRSATTYLQKGQPYEVTVGLSQAMSTSLTVHLSYGGNAVPGVDYTTPSGNIVIPAGQTSLQVAVPTVTSNQVTPDRVLAVSLAPSGSYAIGTPSSTAVTITSTVVPTLTLSANTSAVAQGGAATFTITANQAPSKNTSVSFAVEGTTQAGQGYVPLSGTALLPAGSTQVSVTLQSLQTNVTFEPTDMVVGQWPTRIGEVYVKAGAPVATGSPIVELTEPNLTVTLQASAADRSKLRVGQHCTVQISGQTTTVGNGTITSLNSTPTAVSSSGGQSSQVYEGRIEVADFNGADGAQVSIKCVDEQVTDALTVPIAAVKQNGVGKDVVRVINLNRGGRVVEVPVTTGLTEGSYIQVKSGLHLGQTVVVQSSQS